MHKHMIVDIDEAAELTKIPEKMTVIYPTSSGPIECLLWSTFSLLLHTKVKDIMEHFMVVINGCDKRTGDPSVQDKKQQFLEELRMLKWYHPSEPQARRDMPLSLIRVWSRIGHPESVEMALPWVHTDSYMIMHDDVIIGKYNWTKEVKEKFYGNPNVAIAFGTPELMCANSDEASYQDKPLLRFPHLLCAFLVCRTKHFRKMGSSWCGYHIDMTKQPFTIDQRTGDFQKFLQYYKDINCLNYANPPRKDTVYNYISMEMGAWHFYNAVQSGYQFVQINPDLTHFGAMSWEIDTGKKNRITKYQPVIKKLEREIMLHPDYAPLYMKYLPDCYKS